jgi:hypothetical protein
MINALRRIKLLMVRVANQDIYEFSENKDLMLVCSTAMTKTNARKEKKKRRGIVDLKIK